MTRVRGIATLVLGVSLSACSLAGGRGVEDLPYAEPDEEVVEGSAALEQAGLSDAAPMELSGDTASGEGSDRWSESVLTEPSIELEAPTAVGPPAAFLYPEGGLPDATWRQVDQFVEALTEGRAAETYRVWLEREEVWGDWIRAELREAGLPESLVYLAMIESGFNPTIVSRAGATGMWQFMPGTARLSGLRVDSWIDERRDPVAATHAAIRHLADLYETTGDWALAAAAYNAGLGRVTRARARQPEGQKDYFSLSQARRLPRETRNYVPIMIAAAWVDAHRSRYGLPPREASAPPTADTLMVDGRVRLSVLAEGLSVPYDTLKFLNGHLVRGGVPPEGGAVRVPVGTDTTGVAGFLAAVPPEQRLLPDWIETRYVVRSGDSWWRIARRHDTTVDRLRRLNPRRGDVIHPGDRLVVRRRASYDMPGRVASAQAAPTSSPAATTTSTPAPTPTPKPAQATRGLEAAGPGAEITGTTYPVRSGDTMSGLAVRLDVSLDDLARWNGMTSPRKLRAGETIRVGPPVLRYTVRRGDTMTALARRYGVTLDQLAAWNAMDRPRPLRVGETLVVRMP